MPLVLQLKLTVMDIKPPIWRRVLVSDTTTLRRFHRIIQAVAEWDDYHLHEFEIDGTRYGEPDPDGDVRCRSDARVRLQALPLAQGATFRYVYDFGDDWRVKIKVEKVLPLDPATRYPLCTNGARAFPLEDQGGAWGYEMMLEVLRDPANPEYEHYREWVGDQYDPEAFDLASTNERLERVK